MDSPVVFTAETDGADNDPLNLRQTVAELQLALANQTSESNKEIMELENRITGLRATFEKNELSRRKVEYDLTAARKELCDEIRNNKEEREMKKKEVDSCREELAVKSKNLKKSMENLLHDQGILFDKERGRLKNELKNREEENNNLRNNTIDLQTQIEDLTNKCSNISKELEQLRSINADLKVENENISIDARRNFDELMNRYEHLDGNMSQKIVELKSAENKNQQFGKEKEALVKEVTELMKQENDRISLSWRKKVEELNEKCSLLEMQRVEHVATIEKLADENKSYYRKEKEWMAIEKERESISKELEGLKAINAGLRVENKKIALDARISYDELMNRYTHLEYTMSQTIVELKSAENMNTQIDKEKEGLVTEITYLKQENDRVSQSWRDETQELNEKCSLLENQRVENIATIEKLAGENKSFYSKEKEWMMKEKERDSISKELEELKAINTDLRIKNKEITSDSRRSSDELLSRYKILEDSMSQRIHELKSAEDKNQQFDKEKEGFVTEITSLKQENDRINQNWRDETEQLNLKCSLLETQQIEYTETIHKLVEDNKLIYKKEQELMVKEKEKEDISKKIEELEVIIADLRNENKEIVLDARRNFDELLNRYNNLEDVMSLKIIELKSSENKNQQFDQEKEALVKEVTYLKQVNNKINQNWKEKTEKLDKKCSLLENQQIEYTKSIHKLVEDNKSICNNEEGLMVKNKELQNHNKSLMENVDKERASSLEMKVNTELLQMRLNDMENELLNERANLKVCTVNLVEASKKCIQMESDVSNEKMMYQDLKDKLDKRVCELEGRYKIQCKELNDKSVALRNINREIIELKEELAITKSQSNVIQLEQNNVMRELQGLLSNYGGKYGNVELTLNTVIEVLKPLLIDYNAQIEVTERDLEVVQVSLEKLTIEHEAERRDNMKKNNALDEAERLAKKAQYHCSTIEWKCSDYEKHIKMLENKICYLNSEIEQKEDDMRIIKEDATASRLERDETIESTLSALTIMHDILMTGAVQPSYVHSFSINELKDTIIDKLKQNINERVKAGELDESQMDVKSLSTELRHHKKANRKLRKVNARLLSQTGKYLENSRKEKEALEENLNEYRRAGIKNEQVQIVVNQFFRKS